MRYEIPSWVNKTNKKEVLKCFGFGQYLLKKVG